MSAELVCVGRISRPHGIRGEVNVSPTTDYPEKRFFPGAVFQLKTGGNLTVAAVRKHHDRWLLTFVEIADRTAAETLRQIELLAPTLEIELASDEYFDHQLIGLTAWSTSGSQIGKITAVQHHSAQDLLVIAAASGLVLVPFVAALVPEVDLSKGRILVLDLPGLLDLTAAE